MPLSLSSIIWNWPKGVISLAGKVTAGPRVWWKVMAAYHWVDDTVHNACKESMGQLFTFICKFLFKKACKSYFHCFGFISFCSIYLLCWCSVTMLLVGHQERRLLTLKQPGSLPPKYQTPPCLTVILWNTMCVVTISPGFLLFCSEKFPGLFQDFPIPRKHFSKTLSYTSDM